MLNRDKISAKVISQIALMESIVAVLPSPKAVKEFVEQGLQDVPGVKSVEHKGPDDPHGYCTDEEVLKHFALQHREESYGCLEILINQEEEFEPYRPYITNLASMLGVIYGERRQRELHEKYQQELELMVEERTKALARTLEEKEGVQENLEKVLSGYRSIFENAETGIWVLDYSKPMEALQTLKAEGLKDIQRYFDEDPENAARFLSLVNLVDVNQATVRMFGFSDKNALRLGYPGCFLPETLKSFARAMVAIYAGEKLFREEVVFQKSTGETITTILSFGIPSNPDFFDRITIVTTDITQRIQAEKEKRTLQEQLTQYRKMQAIGQLAGGIAHDFNNMLAGILGGVEILQFESERLTEKGQAMLELVRSSASRSAELTRKLLLFSRQKPSERKVFSLERVLDEVVSLLERTFPSHHRILFQKEAGESTTKGDVAGIQNAVMNLCINASHAIQGAGTVSLALRRRDLDSLYSSKSAFELEPGKYLELSIKDDGEGIPLEDQKKIFEPFYTTKKNGMGTGLGLSTVFAVVKQHMGEITLDSRLGEGSTFTVLLPFAEAGVAQKPTPKEKKEAVHKILVVEDEELVRRATVQLLKKMGHQVEEALSAESALEILDQKKFHFDLILMDHLMSGITGKVARGVIKEKYPELPVLLMSGFTGSGQAEAEDNFLAKPFTRQELALAIRQITNKF